MTIAERIGIAAVAAAVIATGAGAAHAAELPPPVVQGAAPKAMRPPGAWLVSAGARVSLLRSTGYDPFSANDAFSQFSATGLRSFATGPRLATAVGLQWEAGAAQGTARGAETSLSLSRVAAVVEERFVPRPWLYAFGRLAPGWLFASSSVDDSSTVARLESSFSTFCLDASGGLAGRLNPGPQPVGVWLLAESGYGWAPAHSLGLAPALPAADKDKAGVTPLADLAPRGAFFRFSLALDF